MSTPGPVPSRRAFLALAAVLLLAGFAVRAWGIFDRQFLFFDEGVYGCQARYVAGAIRSFPLALRHGWLVHVRGEDAGSEGCKALRDRMEASVENGIYTIYPKETHGLLIALLSLALGDADWVAHAEALLFGLLTLGLVLWVGLALHGPAGALSATLVVALCPLHVMLSRHSLAEADSTFFLVAAVALLRAACRGARSPLRLLFLSGVATGICFTCNFRNAIAPVILWSLYGAELGAPARPLAGLRFRGLVWLCVGMLLPLFAWEAVYRFGQWLLGVPRGYAATYFELVFSWILGQGAPEFGFGEAGALPFFLQEYVGWPVLLCMTLGLWALARKRSADALLLAVPMAWLVAFYELRTRQQCIRYLGPAIPFLALAAGAAVTEAAWGSRVWAWRGAAVRFAVISVLLAQAIAGPHEWLADRAGTRDAFRWLRERRESGDCVRYFCPDNAFGWYYDPPAHRWADLLPPSIRILRKRYEMGTRYIVVTPTAYAHYRMPDYFWPLIQELGRRAPPVEFEHPAGGLPYFAYELHGFGQVVTLADTRQAAQFLAHEGGRIRVYDLSVLFR
ncbi:MAG: hypothetical protein HYZ53_00900 [Planctomycetes bacterium]|nr:hypothetical protein [Planctomycetota bacterium]